MNFTPEKKDYEAVWRTISVIQFKALDIKKEAFVIFAKKEYDATSAL